MKYRTGLKPTTWEKIQHLVDALLHPEIGAAHAAGPKGSADLRASCPPGGPFDQNGSFTCHAHALVGAAYTAFAVMGARLLFVPSPLHVASCTYADLRTAATQPGDTLPVLVDNGAELQDDVNAVAQWGLAPMGVMQSGRFSDVPSLEPADPFPEPVLGQVEKGFRIAGEYVLRGDPSTWPAQCAASLDAGIPLYVGGYVDTAYENLGPSDIAQPPDMNDKNGGGHAQYMVAYRKNAAGELEFLVVGSWGKDWALNGTVWASAAWVAALWTIIPMTVKAVS